MDVLEMEALLRNVDERLQRVEQFLPTLATREELKRFATREELQATVREEGERTRRYFDIVAERLHDDIRILAEGQAHLQHRFDELRHELKTDIANLDVRVSSLDVRLENLDVRVEKLDARVARVEVAVTARPPRSRNSRR